MKKHGNILLKQETFPCFYGIKIDYTIQINNKLDLWSAMAYDKDFQPSSTSSTNTYTAAELNHHSDKERRQMYWLPILKWWLKNIIQIICST